LAQLCEQYGIKFVETEESYTSKSSFLDNDLLPTVGEKPDGWQESGKRIKRGLYRTAKGFVINADCQGAANILRKVITQLGIILAKVGRGVLTLPQRYGLDRKRQFIALSQHPLRIPVVLTHRRSQVLTGYIVQGWVLRRSNKIGSRIA